MGSRYAQALLEAAPDAVVVIDDSGSLAAAAVRQLTNQGFTKAFSLRGGFNGWRAENLPVAKACARDPPCLPR